VRDRTRLTWLPGHHRIVEEALSGRANPLNLAAVFGFGLRTGLRYAQSARDITDGGSSQG
jgi:hypothetical protein